MSLRSVDSRAVEKRVARLVALGPYHLRGLERLAARYWFSLLGDLETIAVYASEKGDCVEGQLEDELVHRDAFYQVADGLGGRLQTSAPVAKLIAFLKTLDGVMSLSLMNVVAEKWLENIFRALERSGICPELFASVGDDEKRHVYGALLLPKGDPREAQTLMSQLELLLLDVSRDPQFLLPLSFLVGEEATARIGLGNVRAHKEACAHLGVSPGPAIRKIEAASRAALREIKRKSRPWPMNEGDVSKFSLNLGAMQDSVEIAYDEDNPAVVEAKVVQALGRILSRYPRMNRTIRAGRLWEPTEVIVGVRREHSFGQLTTVYIHSPQYKTVDEIRNLIRRKTKRLRRRPYESVPALGELVDFLPPPRCAANVTQTAALGVRRGFAAPPTEAEGSPISVCLGDLGLQLLVDEHPDYELSIGGTTVLPTRPQCLLHIGVRWDHRAGDGREIGQLIDLLPQELHNLKRSPQKETT